MQQEQRSDQSTPGTIAATAARSETGRVEAFSDGVFAIAITLLVLELKVPHGLADGHLIDELMRLWPSYLAFLTSFLTIGVMWINHHRLFTLINRSNQTLLVLNGLLLLGVTLVPFPTALVAEFIGRPDERIAAMVYNGLFVLLALCFNMLWLYSVWDNRLCDTNAPEVTVRGITKQFAFGPLAYTAAVVIAWFSAWPSLVLNIALALFYVIPGDRAVLMRNLRPRARGTRS